MRVLIACEESQTVCKAFRTLGHEAYSCDLQECSGGFPEWHIKDNAIKILNSENWELVIAHPPCTYLANSGVHHLHKDKSRWGLLKEAKDFFMEFYNYPGRIAIENPIPHKYAELPKYTQTIQPYLFGHREQKKTCLWLKNLPDLHWTEIPDWLKYRCSCGHVFPYEYGKYGCCLNAAKPFWDNVTVSGQNKLPPSADRAKIRSKTYSGIAQAMAEQWGCL